jgi:hypothetical protein
MTPSIRDPRKWSLVSSWLCALSLIAGGQIQLAAAADDTGIAAVETYGLRHVDRKAVLAAANLDPGDQPPRAVQWKAIAGRVQQRVAGVKRAAVVVITAPFETAKGGTVGRPIVYIGIQESDQPEPHFRAAPSGKVVLPKAIVKVYGDYERTFLESVRHNDFSEDDSNGYALLGNAAARAVQSKFPALADENYDRLVDVLHNSKHAEQRAMAATVIGYATDKKRAASDLIFGTQDPSELVRNDAVRALSVLVAYARNHRDLGIEISTDWCLDLVESLTWTDRNKAMAVLNAATVDKDPTLLAKLRQRSLPSLVEMARWKSAGHAMMAFLLVGRIAGLNDEEIKNAWDGGKREKVIEQALASPSTDRSTDSK